MVPTENDKQYLRCGWEESESLLGIAVVVEQTSTPAFVSNRILLDLVGAVKRRQVEIRRSFVDPPVLRVCAEEGKSDKGRQRQT